MHKENQICQRVLRYRSVRAALLVIAVLAFVISSALLSPATFRFELARSRLPNWINGSDIEVEPTGFVVDTPSCRIPDFGAYNPSITRYVRSPNPQFVVCNRSLPITFTDREYVRLNATLAKSFGIQHCFYQQVPFSYSVVYPTSQSPITYSQSIISAQVFTTVSSAPQP